MNSLFIQCLCDIHLTYDLLKRNTVRQSYVSDGNGVTVWTICDMKLSKMSKSNVDVDLF